MKYPTGVEIHNGKIRITFTYRGIRCREVLRGWVTSNGNIKKAGNLRALIMSEIQMGTFDYGDRFPESKAIKKFTTTQKIKTFKELSDLYLSSKKFEVTAATYDNKVSQIATLTGVIGGNTRLADIQHTDLLNYRTELLTGESIHPHHTWLNKQGRSASTVNGLISLLCSMLKLAHRSQFIKHAIYENVQMLKKSRRDPDPLLPGEYAEFINAVPAHTVLMWEVAIHAGLRHGELCALAWEDVDLDKGEIRISRNITNKGIFVQPKTDAGIRTVTLLAPALEALRKQFRKTGCLAKTEITYHHREYGKTETQKLRFVYIPPASSRKKSGHYFKTSLEYSWEQGIKRAGLRYRVPYQSRHTFACWTLAAGANPSFIAEQMGHENARMVYEVYSKWIGELNRNQVDMIDEKMKSEMPPLRPLCHFVHSKSS